MNKHYQIASPKIKTEFRLFLISDLHYYQPKDLKKYEFITNNLKKEQPDFLLILGDLLDSAEVKEEDALVELIKTWGEYTTVLISIGNHDITIVEKKDTLYLKEDFFWNKLKKLENVFILDNNAYKTSQLSLTGITLPYDYYYGGLDPNMFLKEHLKIDSNQFHILLIHDAKATYNYDLNGIDLILAGHNHNGMVPRILEPIMKNNGIISPGKKWFPKKVRGMFQLKNTNVIISGGVTKLSKRSKLNMFDCFWAHELTKIIIKSDSNYK